MKRIILLLTLTLASLCSQAQLASVVTDKANEAMEKYIPFVIVDTKTQMVLAKEPVKYNPEMEMPTCYFSTVLPSETGITSTGDRRLLAINALPVVDGQRWVINQNRSTGETIFSRRKFLGEHRAQYLWVPIVRGDYVYFLSLEGSLNINWGGFLCINEDGSFRSVKTIEEASEWKIIYAK